MSFNYNKNVKQPIWAGKIFEEKFKSNKDDNRDDKFRARRVDYQPYCSKLRYGSSSKALAIIL